jgi:hypothetical protein
MPQTKNKMWFVKGAYLYSLKQELTESEFIKRAGGTQKLAPYKRFPFVSLVLDNPQKPLLVGHSNGRTINLVITGHGHKLFQTMEWR